MKLLNKNFMLKQVGNEYMIIPVSNNNVNFSKIFNTNEVGAFIFNNLKDHSKEEVLELLVLRLLMNTENELKKIRLWNVDLARFILNNLVKKKL